MDRDYLYSQEALYRECRRRAEGHFKKLDRPYINFDGVKYWYQVTRPDYISRHVWETSVSNVSSEVYGDIVYVRSYDGVCDVFNQFIPLS